MGGMEPYSVTRKRFSTHGLAIRPSRESDFERIIKTIDTVHDELAPRLTRWYRKHPEAFQAEIYGPKGQDPARRIFYVIEKPARGIVGCGGLIQKDPKGEPDIGELTDIYLLKQHRGKGLGKALVTDLVRKARELEFGTIFLTTRKEFTAAVGLYKALGFVQVENTKYQSSNSYAFELGL